MTMGKQKHTAADRPVLSWWELWPLVGWGLFTTYLFGTGKIFLLLRPAYAYLALAGAAILLAAFLYGWILRRRTLLAAASVANKRTEACDECHPHCHSGRAGIALYVRSLAFIIPIGIGCLLPDRGANSLAALQWGEADLAQAAQVAVAREQEKATWERGYSSTTVIGAAVRLRQMQQEKVTAVGLVAHMPQLPPDQFLLVRFKMTCCAADATPVAVPVRWTGAASLKDTTWVKVFGQTDPAAKAVVADEVEPTKEPHDPYL
jgi:uncharacterized repeat protein (TIGR03943 family)